MSSLKYKIPLFDIDWTLLRGSNPAHLDGFDYALQKVYGLSKDISVRNHLTEGKIDSQILMEVAQKYGVKKQIAKEKIQDAMTAVVDYFMNHIDEGHFDVMRGVKHLLEDLKSKSVPMGLLTGNIEEIGWEKMEQAGIRDYFIFGAFGSMAFRRVDLIPIAKKRLSKILNEEVSLERFVIIGDSPLDIACARDGGIPVIASSAGQYNKHQLSHADLTVESLEEKDKIINFLKT